MPQPAASTAVVAGEDSATPPVAAEKAARDGRSAAPLSVLGRTISKAWNDRVLGLSAEAAFWQLLSLPPLLLALVGSLGYVPNVFGPDAIAATEDRLTEWLSSIVTTDVIDSLVLPTVDELLSRGRLDLISIGFAISLWAGSSAMATFVNTIEALERTGTLLDRTMRVFLELASSMATPEMQELESELMPELSAHRDAVLLDRDLFARSMRQRPRPGATSARSSAASSSVTTPTSSVPAPDSHRRNR